ncbi:hypothetical protein LSTR_LSTR014382 [Laodelphax striatellus]|uniref:SCAP beta-propeller domain-containing protein n=1 Tax=Laodelphax striatellus TaxID=195883 RepID=A0A482WYX2_LAOST|nr:hypothetical protein LSTR_LSTR014382 [Laodelphax striatellus]
MSKTEADDNDRLYHALATTMTHHNSSSSSSMLVRNRHHKSHQWDLPDLSSTINTNFTSVTYQPSSNYNERAPNRTAVVHQQSNYDGSVLDRTTGDRHQSNYNGDRLGSGDLGMVEDRTVNHQSANSSRSVVQKVVHQSPTSVLQPTGLQTSDESSGLGGKTTHQNDTTRGGFDYGPPFKSIYEDFERDRVRSGGGGGGMAELENSPIWCIDCQDSLGVVGCANGRMEFWCAGTGQLKFATDEGEGAGLTCVKLVGGGGGGGNQVVAARLNGSLDVYSLSWQRTHAAISLHRRTHIRTGSAGSPLDWTGGGVVGEGSDDQSSFVVVRTSSTRAHQQPITVLDVEGGRVLTGSQDHTLKVMSLLDQVIVYTLHGHCGPITALFVDAITPSTAGSASQDGMLCVWDLLTGACMYSLQAHDGCVTALTYSVSYIISLGADERLCVWERFQGHLLNTIQVSQTYCTSMVMLTHSLLITSKQGSLVVWDVRSGEAVRIVKLGYADNCLFVQHLVPLRMRNSVVCDYGSQLRIVRFPLV